MKAKIIGGNIFVTTDLSMAEVFAALERNPKAGTIVDAKGNELVAADIDFRETNPLTDCTVCFNCVSEGNAAIQVKFDQRIDPEKDKDEASALLANYWDNIAQVCKNLEGAIEARNAAVAAVSEIIEEV